MKSWILCFWILVFPLVMGFVDEVSTKFFGPHAKALRSRFGMVKEGEVRLHFEMSQSNVQILALVIDDPQYFGWYDSPLMADDAATLCTLPSMYRTTLTGDKGVATFSIRSTEKYSVILVLCDEIPTPTNFHVRVEMVNPTVEGNGWNYLPIERVLTRRLLLGNFIAYLCMFLSLLGQFYHSKPESVKWIHHAFLINVIIAALGSIISHQATWELNDHGTSSDGLMFLDSFMSAIRLAVFYFTVLVLSLGWTITKETISLQEYQVVAGFFIFYLTLGVSEAICLSVSDDDTSCAAIPLFLYIIRGIVMISSIIAMNYTVSHLRTLITNLTWCPSIPYLYVRLRNYYNLRSFFLLYILLPTAVLMIQVTMLSWKEEWVVHLFNNIITLAFYVLVGIIFSPLDVSLLTRPFDGTLVSID